MQTFLPYPDFTKSAQVLDKKRLWKQCVEVQQILTVFQNGSPEGGWGNHPAVLQWAGYTQALQCYYNAILHECVQRGINTTYVPFEGLDCANVFMPPWMGDLRYHLSHQSNLLRKDPHHYSQYFKDIPPFLDYFWPVSRNMGLLTREKVYNDLDFKTAISMLIERSKVKMYYVAYKNLDSKKPEAKVFSQDPEKILDNEWSAYPVQEEKDLTEVPLKIMVLLYNLTTENHIIKFSDKKEGARRLFPLLAKLVIELNEPQTEKKGRPMSKREDLEAMVIEVKVEENPKRKGSASYDRFQLYSKSKSVGDFFKKGGTSADLNYDQKQGYIKLKKAS